MKKITANFKGKRALVADDYFTNQELTKELMTMMGCVVDVTENGPATLEKYQNNYYDIIMMDIQMPEMDGYEVTRRIRQIEETTDKKRTTIVAITANAMIGDQEKCLNAGMDDYISKPVKGSYLEEVLTKYLA